MAGSGLQVSRWTKHGHDRLYVATTAGARVGWVDLRTGTRHVQVSEMTAAFDDAVTRWQDRHPSVFVTDLALQRPGAALDERAMDTRPGSGLLRLGARLAGIRTRDYSWRTGAAGERAVGRSLDRLQGSGWHVLHGVQLGRGGDIDHLMIGPAGVFTVNTKHHPRAVVKVGDAVLFVRGRQQPYVGKACKEAQRVADALLAATGRPVPVAPTIVVYGHRSLSGWIRRRPQGVTVLPSWAAWAWYRLPGRPNLSAEQVAALFEVARRKETWTAA